MRYEIKPGQRAVCGSWGIRRTLIVFVLLFLILLGAAVSADDAFGASYASEKTGTVVIDALNVRTGPGTLYQAIGMVYSGQKLTIYGTETDITGGTWYRISYNGGEGYVSADYVTIDSNNPYVHDADFETQLANEGFPESYKKYLRQLHADYPQWVFKACHTGLNWADAVAKECPAGVTLVSGSSPSSWKSMEPGAYNFETGTYIQYDSGNWVTASKAIIEHYMDPRNFLNSGGIFQFLAHSYDSRTQTAGGLARVLDGTFMRGDFPEEGYSTYNDVLMEVGAQSGVNPYVLASMILVEQGSSGNGRSISGNVSGYEGYYNHFNIGAYASGGMDAVTRGLWYASQSGVYGRPWDSRYKSIAGGAQFYSQNYVQNNKYTLYLKKFNVMNGLANVGTGQYMTNVQGAESEAAALRKGYAAVLDSPMTFIIPVYENMPASACLKPASAANNNNYLSSLEATGFTLTPAFNSYQNNYTLTVDPGVNSVELVAKASSSDAVVSGVGRISLTGNSKTVKITVKAASGETRTYTVAITRSAGGQKPDGEIIPPEPPAEDDVIDGIKNTTIQMSSKLTAAGKIRLDWAKSDGYPVDYYEVFRSTERFSGYGTKPYYTTPDGNKQYYVNTKGLEVGKTYYFKVRGVRVVNGKKIYTKWSNKSWRTIKAPEAPGGSDDPDDPAGGENPTGPSDPTDPPVGGDEPGGNKPGGNKPGDDPGDNPPAGSNTNIINGVKNTTIKMSSKLTAAGKIRLDWTKSAGYKVDYYEVFRSTERFSGYGTAPYFVTKDGSKLYYINTKNLLPGKTYYYKVRGVRVIDGKRVYTQWSNKSWRTI